MNNPFSRQFKNINRLKIISEGLGDDLLNKVVFVGGSVVGLYATTDQISDCRPTKDIDCVINFTSRVEYNKVTKQLRLNNFEDILDLDVPICRWIYKQIIVDIMPDNPSILGFTNKWYKDGINNSINYKISEKIDIRIFSSPYFIASKFEAFRSRGANNIRESHDFEDIVYILSYRKEVINEIYQSNQEVKIYLSSIFKSLITNPSIDEIVSYSLPYSISLDKILLVMKNISDINII